MKPHSRFSPALPDLPRRRFVQGLAAGGILHGQSHGGWRSHRPGVRHAGAQATGLFLAITFVLCMAFDLIFLERAMYQAWRNLLPIFEWISWPGFGLGLIESYGYGWYFALIWVPQYNFFLCGAGQQGADRCCGGHQVK